MAMLLRAAEDKGLLHIALTAPPSPVARRERAACRRVIAARARRAIDRVTLVRERIVAQSHVVSGAAICLGCGVCMRRGSGLSWPFTPAGVIYWQSGRQSARI